MVEFEDDPPIPSYQMILDDQVILNNIDRSENMNISLPTDRARMRPAPSTNVGFETVISFTALNVCDKEPFETLYESKLGRNIKVAFLDHLYFGYLSNVVYTAYDIQFDLTYTTRLTIPNNDSYGGPSRR